MGLIAGVMMINETILDSPIALNNVGLISKLYKIEESGQFKRINIDKIWDVLHCFLTVTSASQPIEGNKLSDAVVGVHHFNITDHNADFITCAENDELLEIIAVEKRGSIFDIQVLKKKQAYPSGIWEDDKMQLVKEIKHALNNILNFYKNAFKTRHHVMISIL